MLWGVIDSWLINQQQQLNGDRGYLAAFIFGPLTALILFGIHRLILKTRMMLRGDSHQWNIFADLLPWFVWVAVGLATWSVNEWYHPRPLSMTSPWDWMASLLCVFVLGAITLHLLSSIQTLILKKTMFELPSFVWGVVVVGVFAWFCNQRLMPSPWEDALFSSLCGAVFYGGCFFYLWRERQSPYLAVISVGITTGLVCGFIGGVVGTALILSDTYSPDNMGLFRLELYGIGGIGLALCFGYLSVTEFSFYVRNYIWINYIFWIVILSSVCLIALGSSAIPVKPNNSWSTTWFWSVPITGASVGFCGVLIFFAQNAYIRLKNQDNARWISLDLWWYRRRLTEWNPFWFTALVGIPLLSIFLMSVPAVKDLQMIQQVFAEEGSKEFRSRIELLDPACMALKQFDLEAEQSPYWKKSDELFAKWKILDDRITPQTEGQQVLSKAIQIEIEENKKGLLSFLERHLLSFKERQLLQERVNSSWKDGPLFKQMEQKISDLQAARDAAFSKLMAYIWNQCSLGLGVGLVVDVMLLVGVAAWLNIRRSSKFPSSNYSAHTNKIILIMALVVVVLVVVCVKLLQDKREMSTQYADQQQAQGLSMSDRIALDGLAQMDRNQQQREQIEPSYPVKTPIHNTDFTPYIDAQNRRRQDLLDKQEERLRSEMPWRR